MIQPTEEYYKRKFRETPEADLGIPDTLSEVPPPIASSADAPIPAVEQEEVLNAVAVVIDEADRIISTAQEFMRIAIERLDELKEKLK